MVWIEVESRDKGLQGVQVGHPMTNVLRKLHSLLDVDLDICIQYSEPNLKTYESSLHL